MHKVVHSLRHLQTPFLRCAMEVKTMLDVWHIVNAPPDKEAGFAGPMRQHTQPPLDISSCCQPSANFDQMFAWDATRVK